MFYHDYYLFWGLYEIKNSIPKINFFYFIDISIYAYVYENGKLKTSILRCCVSLIVFKTLIYDAVFQIYPNTLCFTY